MRYFENDGILTEQEICEHKEDPWPDCGFCIGYRPAELTDADIKALTDHITFFKTKEDWGKDGPSEGEQPVMPDDITALPPYVHDIVARGWAFMEMNLDVAKWAICQYYHAPDSDAGMRWHSSITLQNIVRTTVCEGPIVIAEGAPDKGGDSDVVMSVRESPGFLWSQFIPASVREGLLGVKGGPLIRVFADHDQWRTWHDAFRHAEAEATEEGRAALLRCLDIGVATMLFHEVLHLAGLPPFNPYHDEPTWYTSLWNHPKIIDEATGERLDGTCDAVWITMRLFQFGLTERYWEDLDHECCRARDLYEHGSPSRPSPRDLWFNPVRADNMSPLYWCPYHEAAQGSIEVDNQVAPEELAQWENGGSTMTETTRNLATAFSRTFP